MKKITIALALLCFTSGTALAENDGVCEQIQSKDGKYSKWLCMLPKPAPTPRCSVVDSREGILLCDGEIGQPIPEKTVMPKCAWGKNGKVYCQ